MDWAIANPGSYGVYNLYATKEAAEDVLTALKQERLEYINAEVLPFAEWEARRAAELLAPGLREISSDQYFYALEVLTPLQWREDDGVERFCMSEFTAGRITNQYRKLSARPRHHAQRERAIEDFKKPSRSLWRKSPTTPPPQENVWQFLRDN